MKTFSPGDSVSIPTGRHGTRYRWSARVLEVSPDGRFVKVGGNGVLRKGGKWLEAKRVQKVKKEESP